MRRGWDTARDVPPGAERFTFAVIGRNESETLTGMVEQALAAAEPGDEVVFVDSASTDDSAEVAAATGVRVIEAPRGKGRAVAAALAACDGGYACTLDADLGSSERNIPAELRAAAAGSGVDMLVGEFTEHARRRSVQPAIYRPLARALFPESLERFHAVPISGFRVINAELELGDLPPGYGVETHLNLWHTIHDRPTATTDLGEYVGQLRGYANVAEIATDVAAAILDLAVEHGRLREEARPEWDRWAHEVVAVIASQPPVGADESEYYARLETATERPLPSA